MTKRIDDAQLMNADPLANVRERIADAKERHQRMSGPSDMPSGGVETWCSCGFEPIADEPTWPCPTLFFANALEAVLDERNSLQSNVDDDDCSNGFRDTCAQVVERLDAALTRATAITEGAR